MSMIPIMKSDHYELYQDPIGNYSLLRKADHANHLFQDDESISHIEAELDRHVHSAEEKPFLEGFDRMASQFDAILDGDLEMYGPCDEMGRPISEEDDEDSTPGMG